MSETRSIAFGLFLAALFVLSDSRELQSQVRAIRRSTRHSLLHKHKPATPHGSNSRTSLPIDEDDDDAVAAYAATVIGLGGADFRVGTLVILERGDARQLAIERMAIRAITTVGLGLIDHRSALVFARTDADPTEETAPDDRTPARGIARESPSAETDMGQYALLGIGVIIAFKIVFRILASNKPRIRHVRIHSIPHGEAPEEIRRAWVGLVLPLAAGLEGPIEVESVGVVTNRKLGQETGYAVPGHLALAALRNAAPAAAQWWTEHAPRSVEENAILIFPVDCAELVNGNG
jgi:hypothetical protein